MYRVTVRTITETKARKEFEQQLESLFLSSGWKDSIYMCKPSKNSEEKYQAIAVFDVPNPFIPELIKLIQESGLRKVWYEYRDENGSIGAKEFIYGNEEYAMYGSIEDSGSGPIIDVYRQGCENFSKKCAERTNDVVIDITEDQQLHIRKYEGTELKLAIDGSIEKDNRVGDRDYWL